MKTFLISDTHFGHANILRFMRDDGTPLRGGFTDIHHHDEFLIQNWNNVVGVNDKVYHLGDVGFKNFAKVKATMDRLNGTKVLIKGNHDNFKLSQYAQIFKDVRAYHVLDKFVLSHIPVHPYSVTRWKANIHGHLHDSVLPDKKYINVSVEQIGYTPIDFELIRSKYS
jgi:calcineurin-like phosphoesterase family protein